MYSTPLSINALKSVTRAGDSARYEVDVENDLETIVADTHDCVVRGALDFSHRKVPTRAGRELYLLDDYKAVLALRATAKAIAADYKIKPLGRDAIVRGALESLFDATPSSIIRCDFSSFYENINIDPVIAEIMANTRTHPHVKSVLKGLEASRLLQPSTPGIPRGLGLSAVLSELRLKKFDGDIRRLSGTYRYFRFADDFVVFTIANPRKTMEDIKNLAGGDLSFNPDKTEFHTIPTRNDSENKPCREEHKEVNFLGYKFIVAPGIRPRNSRTVRVTISDNKLTKRKTRVILALKDFKKNKNCTLLLRRIQILTSNMSIRRSGHSIGPRSARVQTGIYYNYRACGTYECVKNRPMRQIVAAIPELKHLDGFLHSLLWRSGSEFQADIVRYLSPAEQEKLKRFSFNKGYDKKMTLRLTRQQAAEARKVWRNA